MGFLSGVFSRPKVRADFQVGEKVLTDSLLNTFRDTVRTEESLQAFGAARDTYDLARSDVDDFNRDGAYTRAVISSSRRNLVRSGALSGGRTQTRGSLLEIGGAMNEAVSSSITALDEARARRMQALIQATGLVAGTSQALSISPLVNTALQGAYNLESTRMGAQAQADSAWRGMIGGIVGGAVTGGFSVAASRAGK